MASIFHFSNKSLISFLLGLLLSLFLAILESKFISSNLEKKRKKLKASLAN